MSIVILNTHVFEGLDNNVDIPLPGRLALGFNQNNDLSVKDSTGKVWQVGKEVNIKNKLVSFSLIDLNIESFELLTNQNVANYINGLNITALEGEIYYFEVSNTNGDKKLFILKEKGIGLIVVNENDLILSRDIKTISSISPFTMIDQGNGLGIYITDRDNSYYGIIGDAAFDFSFSDETNGINGATGLFSFALGSNTIASGIGSFVTGTINKSSGYFSSIFGYLNNSEGTCSFVTGINNNENGYSNLISGIGHNVKSTNVTVIGQASEVIDNDIQDFNFNKNKPLFVIGNGVIANNDPIYSVISRSNAFVVKINGEVSAPSLTMEYIATATDKVLITKEWVNNKYAPIGDQIIISENSIVQESWEGKYIFVTQAVTITLPNTLSPKFKSFNGRTMGGGSITWVTTSPFVWETTPINTPEKTPFLFIRFNGGNTIILDQ